MSVISRRRFTQGLAALPLLSSGYLKGKTTRRLHLVIDYKSINITGRRVQAITVNDSLPGPTLRWQEGDTVDVTVHNRLPVMSAIHWHGLILPSNMDGVPGLSFDGIPPGGSYRYRFTLKQSGTYWYHAHAGFQEQQGVYGAIVINPADREAFTADREHILVLSDWSDEEPQAIFATLKKNAHIYNRNRRTLGDIVSDIKRQGVARTYRDREMWNLMRMPDTDLADVSGYTYTYLMNGVTPRDGWLGQFKPGEEIKLRIINAAAMSIFDFRIPDLKMRVVGADGQAVAPITVDELRLAAGETLDVHVTPEDDRAYTLFAQSIDRSGFARGTLTPRQGLTAEVPDLDPVPRLQHIDMGMAPAATQSGQDHHHHHHHHHHSQPEQPLKHHKSEYGPGVDMHAESVSYRLDDPGVGLRNNGRRVLTYADLRRLNGSMSMAEPQRELELHLTGNMNRYMWSFNGIRYEDAEPIRWQYGERIRITLVNDTMMIHPIHLHGMWSELESGDESALPAKHTIMVQPGSKISYRVSADARGNWAYHCHNLYHMMGMFREVIVT